MSKSNPQLLPSVHGQARSCSPRWRRPRDAPAATRGATSAKDDTQAQRPPSIQTLTPSSAGRRQAAAPPISIPSTSSSGDPHHVHRHRAGDEDAPFATATRSSTLETFFSFIRWRKKTGPIALLARRGSPRVMTSQRVEHAVQSVDLGRRLAQGHHAPEREEDVHARAHGRGRAGQGHGGQQLVEIAAVRDQGQFLARGLRRRSLRGAGEEAAAVISAHHDRGSEDRSDLELLEGMHGSPPMHGRRARRPGRWISTTTESRGNVRAMLTMHRASPPGASIGGHRTGVEGSSGDAPEPTRRGASTHSRTFMKRW